VANYQNVIPIRLGQAAITASYTTLYTTPLVTRTYVKDLDISNTTAATVRIFVHIVPVGDTPTTANALFYNTPLPAYTTMQWTGSQLMNIGDTIQIRASVTGCAITVSGGEAT
jgi:hypothetical protein